jgi:hypothetical protein
MTVSPTSDSPGSVIPTCQHLQLAISTLKSSISEIEYQFFAFAVLISSMGQNKAVPLLNSG